MEEQPKVPEHVHLSPCGGLRVIETQVAHLREWELNQNSHLASIDRRLQELSETIGKNRVERTEQIANLSTRVTGHYTKLLWGALTFLVPITAALAYIIIGHVLGP